MKAAELARVLSVDRARINQLLYGELGTRVQQDSSYRWRLLNAQAARPAPPTAAPQAITEVGRLCRYYLECVGPDADEGVSTFARSNFGSPSYAELPALPMLNPEIEWTNAPGVQSVLGAVRNDKSNLIVWLGYPVRLREHQTANWHGFFVEPVMLWPVEIPDDGRGPAEIADDLPTPNSKVLRRLCMGDPAASVEEAARLEEELGFNGQPEDRPEIDEVIRRLVSIRPDWDWQEQMTPEECSSGLPLSEINQTGIFNRAIIVPGKRSPFTRGLESELKKLADVRANELSGTVLSQWLENQTRPNNQTDTQPILEVVPMNSEQRAAVRAALNSPHTVVTGPPGTGKSQVVTNILANAAWRGMKVIFASKNNKAVDVVEGRVNGLANRPTLMRLGSKEYQADLAEFLSATLAGTVTPDDQLNYDEALDRHKKLSLMRQKQEEQQERTLQLRNAVDRIESEAETLREIFSEASFRKLGGFAIQDAESALNQFAMDIEALDSSKQNLIGKILLAFTRKSRVRTAIEAKNTLDVHLASLDYKPIEIEAVPNIEELNSWCGGLRRRLDAAKVVRKYQETLEELRTAQSLEELARKDKNLAEEICESSQRLWRAWVQLTPNRLNAEDRQNIARYVALLRAQPDGAPNPAIQNPLRAMQRKVSHLFPCWAVTSLAARGRVPFTAGHFDLVVIDEASQCDIASALPLLFRAKRCVIIGDPQQLRHISALTKSKDLELAEKYGLLESRQSWMYRANSLYDLSTGVASAQDIVNLLDHHRSHAHIIQFSNTEFYNRSLRVATRYTYLKRPRGQNLGIRWNDVTGNTVRPNGSSAQNEEEARAVVAVLRNLIVERHFEGTVGVVTPFKAQRELIHSMISECKEFAASASSNELMVDTIHRFQGDERDVMLFSPVISRGAARETVGFLRSNGNLFNVAITRARGVLHVVGDRNAALASEVPYFRRFAEYALRLESEDQEEQQVVDNLGSEYPPVAHPERVSDWERKVLYPALYNVGIRAIPQYNVEQYDLDFAVIIGDRRLNIEVDGERYHRSWTGELCLRDRLRNQRLIELGWEVKRFWVYEVRDRLPECVQFVKSWIERGPN
jgi:very-short-patch-repair endonuclease